MTAKRSLQPMDQPTTDPGLPLRYPFPPGELGAPPPLLGWARKKQPVCPVALPSGDRVWMVTRKDDITRVLTDPGFSRDLTYPGAPRFVGDDFTSVPGGIFNLDPPDHTRVRQVINRFYTRGAVERHRPVIEDHAVRLLDDMAHGSNPADLMPAYAAALPPRVAREILAVPAELHGDYHSCFRTQTHLAASAAAVAAATASITDFTREVIETKRRDPDPDEPIGALIRARSGGLISEDELIGTTSYLFVTGSEPLTAPLGTGVVTLLTHPRQLRECVKAPDLWPKAVEEILRYHHNGVLGMPRVATDDVTLHDVTIRKGEGVCCPMLGATHDPAHYPNPSRFNIHRTTDASATFGAGPHFCLGAPLTRLFLHTAYRTLFTRFPSLFLAAPEREIPWEDNVLFTKPASLPIAW
ncbi:cytochrome P450 [Streptomyces sp. HU2014]|uniref:cytochrome P450 n=1 Tax=Streptomyces sp. HU2014 TaxID=2939414 RepID=UPI00200C0A70|nr:cytochrome P450 [Streptomyces sp. HU2014]UQI46104.1 cytochrome P450 [Streptomyces sp. HU2014]